jgi:hypothetical protein
MKTIILLFFFSISFLAGFSQFSADIETGIVKVNRNDASSSWKNSFGVLNGLDGTLFSYTRDFNNFVKPSIRIRISYAFGKSKRHLVSFLAAPLQYRTDGILRNPIIFNSTVFEGQKQTEGFYKFSGYRLTYRYNIIQRKKVTLGVGLTLNLRDAEFSIKQGEKYERNYNRGLVPLINTYLSFKLTNKLGFLIDGDVFYVDKTGGAIDYLTGLNYSLNRTITLATGYRFFSGVGSEKGNVYNKLFVSSFVFGGVINFK